MATKSQINKVWDKAKQIPGKGRDKYRQDPYENVMYRDSYGRDSAMGWEVDHIMPKSPKSPKSRGGSDATRNLQALNTKLNRSKGNTLVKKSRHSKSNK